MTRLFPFLVRLVVPRAIVDFENIVPANDVVVIANTAGVLVRSDIHPALIDLLARAIEETHSKPWIFQQTGEFPKLPDPEYRASDHALDFYKNGPSLLNRYLPFWITNYAQRLIAILIACIAVVFPLFNYAPKLYRWLVEYNLRSIYHDLRAVDARLQKDVAAVDLPIIQAELSDIDRRIGVLGVPLHHSDLFFSIKSHIDVVRTRLELRRSELQTPARRPSIVI